MSSVSAYQQMQNWAATQGAMNSKILSSAGSAAAITDSANALANAANNTISSQGNLAAQAALARIHKQTQSATASSGGAVVNGAAAAKTAGNAILSSLGLNPGDLAASYQTSAPSSASGPYAAPTNPATGHGYALTSGNDLAAQSAVNLFA
jgi:hypothetical protein